MYLEFSGEIPAGHYGAGKMTIWDGGTYETEKWSDREVMVVLHGERARGRYVLFQTKDNQWMIHRMDPPEDPDRQPLPDRPAADAGHAGHGHPQGRGELVVRREVGRDPGPGHDFRRPHQARGPQRPRRHPPLPGARAPSAGRSAPPRSILDGEIVALDPATGRPSFERHATADARRIRERHPPPPPGRARHLRHLRPALARRAPDHRTPLLRAPPPARRPEPGRAGLAHTGHPPRRGPGAPRRHGRLRSRRCRGQAARLRLRARRAHPALAQDQEPPLAGVRRRRLSAGRRIPGPIRCAAPRRLWR